MSDASTKKYGAEHAKAERKYFYIHLMIFILVHILFVFLFGLVPEKELPSGSYLLHLKEWFLTKETGYYMNESVNSISGVWVTALIVHAIWAFSYLIFPKKAPKDKDKTKVEKQDSIKEEPKIKEKKEFKMTEGRAWLFLVIGGLIEIYWAAGLKADSFSILTIAAILISFELLIRSTKVIPVGTAYAVFTGIGTIGTIVVDLVVFHEPFKLVKILLILLLAGFIIGLKFTGDVPKGGDQ